MTFNEAVEMCTRIEGYAIGTWVKGMKIDSLFIGPTRWEEMNDFLNSRIQIGEEAAILKFSGKSFSVYGVSVDKKQDVPRYTMIILDQFEKIMSN